MEKLDVTSKRGLDPSQKTLDPSFHKALETAHQQALAHLETLDKTSVAATADISQLRAALTKTLSRAGLPADQVISELARDVREGLLGSAGGRFFGWVIGGVLPAALAADWLTSAWQQNAALYACSPAAAVVEETVGVWLKDILGLPERASFALVSGCQMAHVTCLAAARHALLARRGWEVEERGLVGAPAIRILTSTERHGTLVRAARLLGLGAASVRTLPANAQGQLDASGLERELRALGSAPGIVTLQAGDVNT